MNTYTALKLMQAQAGIVTSKIISGLISEYGTIHKQMKIDYEAYKAKQLPILKREPKGDKINSKLNNDFRGEIVDQGIGYLLGKPITYQVNKEIYGADEAAYQADQKTLKEFLQTSYYEDLDKETGKKGGICGTAARLCYVDKQGQLRMMNLPPWEVIFIQDASLDTNQYVLRYYEMQDIEGNVVRTYKRVEWYDDQHVTYYIGDKEGNYVLDSSEPANPQQHMFDMVPVIEFPNNEERLNDFVKVEANIDAYDRTVSVAQDEIEEFRTAYLAFLGCTVNEETVKLMQKTGAVSLPGDGADAKFLTKDINGNFIIDHKKTLRENIYRFSKTVDMSADTFSGSGVSGESRKWLLLALEFRAGTQQLKFAKALTQMFQVLTTGWAKKGIKLTWKNIEFMFDRNMPAELLQESQIQATLKGVVSDKLRLGLFSPVRDVESEMKQEADENQGNVNLDTVPTAEEQAALDAAKAAADKAAADKAASGK